MMLKQIGHYEIDEMLGVGGMGEVYRARDTQRNRVVALKVLPEAFAGDREYLARFRRESFLAARLREPHVIPIHDFGDIDGRLFIDMRLVDGTDLGRLVSREGPLPALRAVHLISQVAEALDAAHADGLVHRDIKPSNILVTQHDFVYVVDFGIARTVGSTRATALTITGATIGTLDYMAPERFTNQPIDGRADVYSLACVLYESITGRRPFPGDDLPSLMYAHLYLGFEPPSALAEGVGPALDEVVQKGMAKDREERYPSAGAFAAAAQAAVRLSEQRSAGHAPAVAEAGSATRATDVALGDTQLAGTAAAGSAETQQSRGPWAPHSPGTSQVELAPGHRNGEPTSPEQIVVPDALPTVVRAPMGPRLAANGNGSSAARSGSRFPGGPGAEEPPPRNGGPSGRGRFLSPRVLVAALAVLLAVAGTVYVTTLVHRPHDGMPTASSTTAAPTPVLSTNGPVAPAPQPSFVPSRPDPQVVADVAANATPGFIELAPNGSFAYICNRTAGFISVLDTARNQVVTTIPVPQGPPQYVSFSPDGKVAFVSVFTDDRKGNEVVFVDTRTNQIFDEIHLGVRPYASAVSPDGKTLWVPSHDENLVYVVDISTHALVAKVDVAPTPHWVAITPDGKSAYVANHDSNKITRIDTASYATQEIPAGRAPHSTAISRDGTLVAVVNYMSNEVTVVKTATNTVVATIPVDANPQDIAFAPDGQHLYTANNTGNSVSVISTRTMSVVNRIPVEAPTSVTVQPNGRQAYVTSLTAGTVRVLAVGRT